MGIEELVYGRGNHPRMTKGSKGGGKGLMKEIASTPMGDLVIHDETAVKGFHQTHKGMKKGMK